MMAGVVESSLNIYCPAEQYPEEWDIKGLTEMMHSQFGLNITPGKQDSGESLRDLGRDALVEDMQTQVREAYARREQELGPDLMRFLEKTFMLQVIDHHWKDHLLGMDHLRDGIGLRGYGQKDPLIEYKREGFDIFAGMMERIKSDTLDRLFHVQAVRQEGEEAAPTPPPPPVISHPQPKLILNRGEEPVATQTPVHRADDKVGRNDPCPCGSGKKYKKCHGA
jgi:preprotein translocase subunit SecA